MAIILQQLSIMYSGDMATRFHRYANKVATQTFKRMNDISLRILLPALLVGAKKWKQS